MRWEAHCSSMCPLNAACAAQRTKGPRHAIHTHAVLQRIGQFLGVERAALVRVESAEGGLDIRWELLLLDGGGLGARLLAERTLTNLGDDSTELLEVDRALVVRGDDPPSRRCAPAWCASFRARDEAVQVQWDDPMSRAWIDEEGALRQRIGKLRRLESSTGVGVELRKGTSDERRRPWIHSSLDVHSHRGRRFYALLGELGLDREWKDLPRTGGILPLIAVKTSALHVKGSVLGEYSTRKKEAIKPSHHEIQVHDLNIIQSRLTIKRAELWQGSVLLATQPATGSSLISDATQKVKY
jgi:hypothetical protein